MIDRTTLPVIPAGVEVEAGTRFTVRGLNFDEWPDFIAIAYSSSVAVSGVLPGTAVMGLVSKTNTELVFELGQTHTYSSEHEWSYFAAGLTPPRSLLEYGLI